MKKLIDNVYFVIFVSCLVVFLITIWNTPFAEAVTGSIFFGLLAAPITAFVLSLLNSLLPE